MSVGFMLGAPLLTVATHPLALPSASSYELSSGRLLSSLAGVVGLAGAVVGGLALLRSTGRRRTGPGRRGAVISVVFGMAAVAVGALVAVTADGGLGTGNGLGGSVVAMVVGLVATTVGGVAVARWRG